jgi:tetratricopeptide (TPR) repeat protein
MSINRRILIIVVFVAVTVLIAWLVASRSGRQVAHVDGNGGASGQATVPAPSSDGATRDRLALERRGPEDAGAAAAAPTSVAPLERSFSEQDRVDALPPGADVTTVFTSGAQLIQDNSGESLGQSRAQLEAGVQRVLDALARGYPERVRAYRLLSGAYNALWSRAATSPSEMDEFRRKERETYERLMDLEPSNPDWTNSYVGTFTKRDEALAALRRVLHVQPDNALTRFALGRLLCEMGSRDEGLAHLIEAARALPAKEVELLGSRIAATAQGCGGDDGLRRVTAALGQRSPRDGSDAEHR